MTEKGPSLGILKERQAKRCKGQAPIMGCGVSLKGLSASSYPHLPTVQNKGRPRNERGRKEVSRETRRKCNMAGVS